MSQPRKCVVSNQSVLAWMFSNRSVQSSSGQLWCGDGILQKNRRTNMWYALVWCAGCSQKSYNNGGVNEYVIQYSGVSVQLCGCWGWLDFVGVHFPLISFPFFLFSLSVLCMIVVCFNVCIRYPKCCLLYLSLILPNSYYSAWVITPLCVDSRCVVKSLSVVFSFVHYDRFNVDAFFCSLIQCDGYCFCVGHSNFSAFRYLAFLWSFHIVRCSVLLHTSKGGFTQ